jgi:hypothetical protein
LWAIRAQRVLILLHGTWPLHHCLARQPEWQSFSANVTSQANGVTRVCVSSIDLFACVNLIMQDSSLRHGICEWLANSVAVIELTYWRFLLLDKKHHFFLHRFQIETSHVRHILGCYLGGKPFITAVLYFLYMHLSKWSSSNTNGFTRQNIVHPTYDVSLSYMHHSFNAIHALSLSLTNGVSG